MTQTDYEMRKKRMASMVGSKELEALEKDIELLLQDGDVHGAKHATLLRRLKELVVSGAEVLNNDILDGAMNLIQRACITGRPDHLKLFIELGGDVNALTSEKKPPLHLALIKGGNKEIFKLLLNAGADTEIREGFQRTPLHYAAFVYDRAFTDMLLDRHADIHARDLGKDTPLHLAVQENNKEVATALMERGADINADPQNSPIKHYDGTRANTPLDVAIDRGCDDSAALLIGAGATCKERHLYDAINHFHGTDSPTLSMLVPMFPDYKPDRVMEADEINWLIGYGIGPNNMMDVVARWYKGRTGGTGRVDRRKALTAVIEAGFDMSLADEKGNTLFHHVLNCSEVIARDLKVLFDAGAGEVLNTYNDEGYTPFQLYLRFRLDPSKSLVMKMLDHGADPTLTARSGHSFIDDVNKLVPGYIKTHDDEATAQENTVTVGATP